MADLSPRDIAVVLRSIGRRVKEAAEAAEPEPLPADALAALDREVAEVTRQAGLAPTRDRAADAAAAADHIEHVPASQWTDETLGRLRESAGTIGHALRRLEEVGEAGGNAGAR